MEILYGMLHIGIKTVLAAVVLFILARLMGKKQIAQLSFFDYVVGISIGSVAAAMSVEPTISIPDGITSMVIWALLPIIFSSLSLHSIVARRLLDGTPLILIQNGRIIGENLRKSKLTVNDLLEELRLKDIFRIADIEFAILETSGKLSILKTAENQPVTVKDMHLPSQSTGIYANVIIDGKLMRENMRQMHIDEAWLKKELKKQQINSVKNVLLASCNANGVLYVDKKNDVSNSLTIFQ